jgi:4-amino-4-deoxy-L-arabinose transferase-like glycosyltransferase
VERSLSSWSRDLLVLVSVALVALSSFLSKPAHMDDPVYLWVAEQIQRSPGDFFGFTINWQGTRAPVYLVNKNPPLVSYYFALWGWLGAKSVWALHCAALPIALFAVGGVYALARRLCVAPLVAAALALATPAFVVSATTLMADVMMLGWWCAAVWLWIHGLDRGRSWVLAAASLAVALCALTDYYGMSLLPLLFAYTLLRARRFDRRVAWLLLPVALLLAYEAYTHSLYGHGALSNAMQYTRDSRARMGPPPLERCFTALSFTGGALLAVSLLGPLFRRWALVVTAAAAALLLVVLPPALDSMSGIPLRDAGGRRWDLLLPLVLFVLAGANVLALALWQPLRERLDPDASLLALWVLGTFVFAGFLNWTLNGRVVLPMAPAVAMLAVRERASLRPAAVSMLGRHLALPALAGLALSLGVARGDEQWAEAAPLAAEAIVASHEQEGRGRLFFQGHWGLQYYIQPLGARSYDRYRDFLRVGDLVVVPLNNSNLLRFPDHWIERVRVLRIPSSRWFTLNAFERGAGFYSSVWGPLPFAVGAAPEEVYEVQRMLLRIAPARPGS